MKRICLIICLLGFAVAAYADTERGLPPGCQSAPCSASTSKSENGMAGVQRVSSDGNVATRNPSKNGMAGVQRASSDGDVATRHPTKSLVRREIAQHSATALEERVAVHFDSIPFENLLSLLVPRGWRIKFDVEPRKINHRVVFHAETTRRTAIRHLLFRAGLSGRFYQNSRILLISNLYDD